MHTVSGEREVRREHYTVAGYWWDRGVGVRVVHFSTLPELLLVAAMNEKTAISVKELGAFQVRFGGFADLPAVKGRDFVNSPEFTCFGHKWHVRLWPGGSRGSPDGTVAVYLRNRSPVSIDVQAT